MKKMMKRKPFILVMLFLGIALNGYSQDTLTVQQAIAHALSQNYEVMIQHSSAEQVQNLAHAGQAGLLPTISFNASAGYGVQNTRLEVANQPNPIENTGAKVINYSAAVQLNYTAFNGFANRYRFDQLKINADLADINTRLLVENTVLQVVSAYYDALRTQQNLEALYEALLLSGKNLELAMERQNLSGGSKLNTLNAQVNYERDSINYLNAQNVHRSAMIALNLVMGEENVSQMHLLSGKDEALGVFDEIGELETLVVEQNAQIQAVRQQKQLSMLDLRIAKASYSPVLNLQSSYSVNVTDNEGSFILLNRSNGFNGGATLSIPIFAGNTRSRNYENAKLALQSTEFQEEQVLRSARASLFIAWDTYQTSLVSVSLERKALETARLNLELSESKYKTGQINSTQLREAQVNLVVAQNSFNNAIYNLRLAETELLRLSGKLLQ